MNLSISGYNSTGGAVTVERYSDVVYSIGSTTDDGYAKRKSDNRCDSDMFDYIYTNRSCFLLLVGDYSSFSSLIFFNTGESPLYILIGDFNVRRGDVSRIATNGMPLR